ncbi:replication restart helicase PriA [Helicobacter fennelliae]|uniref:Replication restart protein PriA n=1 Tax=Helicobacter fennelliae MRY12-0050 TaxID=1325130 RepID=T1CRP4_9HELI|nr:primosomal protein N' [Helicobacter fennelliae]GAD19414.1 helicase PriA essential for oriC/DnaA-independent DNA replication [Helicobacter fennelliae MRY12-0050]STP08450.1 primosomal replication factor [Helicobacter fennelliae]
MFFYCIAALGLHSPLLTYQSPLLLQKGQCVRIQIKNKHHKGVVLRQVNKPDFVCKTLEVEHFYFNRRQQILADFIAYYYHCSYAESYNLFEPFMQFVWHCNQNLNPKPRKKQNPQNPQSQKMQNLNLPNLAPKLDSALDSALIDSALDFNSESTLDSAYKSISMDSTFWHTKLPNFETIRFFTDIPLSSNRTIATLKPLSQAQLAASNFIESKHVSLLFGDTGSGKTEIYFYHIAKALSQNKSALFLMPEIALTPQILARLESSFGDCVGVWHSKLTKAQKQNIINNIYTQRIKIIAGARSALFLPLANLGVIIVDEEHDEAYKSLQNPRYNARDLCLFLAQKAHIKVILGSATPSLSSYVLAKNNKYLYRLKGRFFDSAKDFILEQHKCELSPNLLQHLHQTLESKKQAIFFLPTRAHFKSLLCLQCGYGFQCPFCSVNMSLHLSQNALVCHYCAYTQAIPNQCLQCNNHDLSTNRIGTAQIADELKVHFPHANIAVFDKDHASTHKKLKEILHNFNTHKIDILVGTQMLSKGHDYHNVALAVVMGIDYVLNGGDFKSFERGIALLHQIAGRSGRKERGKVFIQSLQTDWIRLFLGDYEEFLKWEFTHRSHAYPPFKRLAMIHFSHTNKAQAKANMLQILPFLERNKEITIIGYGQNAIEKIANKWRFHILLSAPKTKQILSAIQNLDVDIDIDALDTL